MKRSTKTLKYRCDVDASHIVAEVRARPLRRDDETLMHIASSIIMQRVRSELARYKRATKHERVAVVEVRRPRGMGRR